MKNQKKWVVMKVLFLFAGLFLFNVGVFASSGEKFEGFEEGQSSDRETKKILFLDDDSINRKVGASLLKKSLEILGLEDDYTVEIAEDGLEAVNMAGKTSYSLIIMDVEMPNMNGAEATYEIKQMDPNAIIIRFSTLAEDRVVDIAPEEAKETILKLFSGVLPKPVLLKDIQDLLKQFLPTLS